MGEPIISSAAGVLSVLVGICALFFYLEERTKWKLFYYLPPLIFIYAVPAVLSNVYVGGREILSRDCAVYGWLESMVLPMFLVIMLLKVDVVSTIKVMGRGVFVMLIGTAGVVLGGPLTYLLVRDHLPADAWKAFGTLAGSWIGGTGNMAATKVAIGASPESYGLAVIGDNLIIIIWLPILLASKSFAKYFNRFTRVDSKRMKMLESIDVVDEKNEQKPAMRHFLYLIFLGVACAWIAQAVAERLPEFGPVLTQSTWRILLITTMGLGLSLTPARRIPCSHELAMALVYVFVANMGAQADVSVLDRSAAWFIAACYIWIAIHGAFCLLGAYLLRVDIHSTAIASAANIGGAASAPVVASHHNEKLVPVSILMALMGYAVGNYGAIATAWMCSRLAG